MISILTVTYCTVFSEPLSGEDIRWARGKELNRQSLVSNTGTWVDAPLRPLLDQLSRQRRIALFVDRRVDPSKAITLHARNLTWEQLLYKIGKPHGYGFCKLEGLYYFGPKSTAVSLPTNYEKLNRWTRENRADSKVNWRRPTKAAWRRLASPKDLMVDWTQEFEIQAVGLSSIDFDVWQEGEFGALPLNLKLAILTVGFDRWLAVSKSGTKVKVVPYPVRESVTFVTGNLSNVAEATSILLSQFPSVSVAKKNKTVLALNGRPDRVYAAIETALAFQNANEGVSKEKTFTAELKGTRGSIVATMAVQLEAEMEFDPTITDLLSQHIEFDVSNASVEEILGRALEGTGIEFEVENKKLKLWIRER